MLLAWIDGVVSLGPVGSLWREDVAVLVRQRENVMAPTHLPDLIFELPLGGASLRAQLLALSDAGWRLLPTEDVLIRDDLVLTNLLRLGIPAWPHRARRTVILVHKHLDVRVGHCLKGLGHSLWVQRRNSL